MRFAGRDTVTGTSLGRSSDWEGASLSLAPSSLKRAPTKVGSYSAWGGGAPGMREHRGPPQRERGEQPVGWDTAPLPRGRAGKGQQLVLLSFVGLRRPFLFSRFTSGQLVRLRLVKPRCKQSGWEGGQEAPGAASEQAGTLPNTGRTFSSGLSTSRSLFWAKSDPQPSLQARPRSCVPGTRPGRGSWGAHTRRSPRQFPPQPFPA